jgi:Fe2+ transport system protein B
MTASTPSIVLAGFESAGKTALFRRLTGEATGHEANFRGSTVSCRSCYSAECRCEIIDTPGMRLKADTVTTRLALEKIQLSDTVLLVVRGTNLQQEIEGLLREINASTQRLAVAVTFTDKDETKISTLAAHYQKMLGVPVVALNARDLPATNRTALLAAIQEASLPITTTPAAPQSPWKLVPSATWFEHRGVGPMLSLLVLALLWIVPVIAAFKLADFLQPIADTAFIGPVTKWLNARLSPLAADLLTGGYGVLTLGWYSFLWAFPVVLFVGLSTAICEETGLQDRIMRSLDPLLRPFSLSGRDLMPILSGFGCNVVAVHQSRACSSCTRKSCVSMIAFGSACSYQIGATLSVLGAGGHGWLFAPYLALLFIVGLIHTRIWNGKKSKFELLPVSERAFLHFPKPRALWWRVKAVLRQFLLQAMPIFILICILAALLDTTGVLGWLANTMAPLLKIFHLPGEVAPAILFSILRKDGLLTINQGEGALAASLTTGQVFTLVWLAGTLTACLVTLWTIRKELGWRTALSLAGKQATTSLAVAALLSLILR